MLNNPLINPVILAHINLVNAVKEQSGTLTNTGYSPAFYHKLSDGRPRADSSLFLDLITVNITFPQAACVVSFLASRMAIAWINAIANRAIELQCGDIKITIKGTNDIERAKKLYQGIAASEQPTKSDE